jgi:plastocyanin
MLDLIVAAVPARATGPATTYTVGVDGAGPAGHNFEYVDFFPRAGTIVHRGDVIDFKWSTGSLDGLHTTTPDGLHTTTLVPSGVKPDELVVPDDGHGDGLMLNPAVLAPSDPTCGGVGNPCDYNGTALLNSGAIPNAAGGDFYVKIDVGAGGQVNFICEIHPGMQGTLNVVSDGTPAPTPAKVAARGEAQLRADTRAAREAEEEANDTSVVKNPDGTRTVTLTAGTAVRHVEIAEMLPSNVEIHPGDTVKWITRALVDPHTVTFPKGPGSDAVDPVVPACEGANNGADSSPPCANPAAQELHLIPQPQGATEITSPSTIGSSGIISTFGVGPDNYSFKFPNQGTFAYVCRIHENMVGTVQAEGGSESE